MGNTTPCSANCECWRRNTRNSPWRIRPPRRSEGGGRRSLPLSRIPRRCSRWRMFSPRTTRDGSLRACANSPKPTMSSSPPSRNWTGWRLTSSTKTAPCAPPQPAATAKPAKTSPPTPKPSPPSPNNSTPTRPPTPPGPQHQPGLQHQPGPQHQPQPGLQNESVASLHLGLQTENKIPTDSGLSGLRIHSRAFGGARGGCHRHRGLRRV